ncbi:hypothetical protein CEUSTIGMA_g14011.t1 [Chlamydomonas eustigma]|uniref:DNA 3'-5' helicase n=1 Tax=Chlamydomonas eustigma TaxID=1157962 RepID=A0A250XUA2_9CHLO|nr:hypothetical protein CEUSTIGMA_g14011.t1 [Chlamydomonas eustigma]|eukprot:GAX86603.1 hypothetical protein CEUSTIGMA_g14011.t1 [Chlamydomonas eustigma]
MILLLPCQVHASISKSIENYYQESGRAGRDRAPARCMLLYKFSDAMRQAAIVCMDPNWNNNLMDIMRYAAAAPGQCRRAVIQAHFAEEASECYGMCDLCEACSKTEQVDVSNHAVAILKTLQAMPSVEKRATLIQLIDGWRGNKGADPDSQKEAKRMSKDECEVIVAIMVLRGLLQFDFGFTAYMTTAYLKASPNGMQLLDQASSSSLRSLTICKRRTVQQHTEGSRPRHTSGSGSNCSAAETQQAALDVQQALLLWREEVSRVLNVFPSSVLPLALVQHLSSSQEWTEDGLHGLIGPNRGRLHGKQLHTLLLNHKDSTSLAHDPAGTRGWTDADGYVTAAGFNSKAEVMTKSVNEVTIVEKLQQDKKIEGGSTEDRRQQAKRTQGRKHEVIKVYSSEEESQDFLPQKKRPNKTKG